MNLEEKYKELIYIVEGIGKEAFDYFNSGETENEIKKDGSAVTRIDKKIETMLREYVKTNFEEDTIVGEEKETKIGTSGFVWHIDPIDGTDNFLRKVPFFAISIARLGDNGEESFAIVHNPATKQTFSTFKETAGGVYENERLCNLTAEPLGGKYVISIGRRASAAEWMKPATYALNKELGMRYGRCGSYNCTALELAYVAANRIDAFLSFGLDTYDYAAGLLLTKAAGASISVFEDGAWTLWEKDLKEFCSQKSRIFFVSHPDIHNEILEIIGDPALWADR